MNYLTRYRAISKPFETCVVGSGGFGRSFLSQSRFIPLVNARVAIDVNADIAAQAFQSIGIEPSKIARCYRKSDAMSAWSAGKYLACGDLSLVDDLPIDLVVEATGDPESGARHCKSAIELGRNVALASKEVDSVVGPILAHLAQLQGKVVTPVDGDQPALLIGLITWAQTLGFEIIAAGKSSEYDFVFDWKTQVVSTNGVELSIPELKSLWDMAPHTDVLDLVTRRALVCEGLPQRAVPDLCELQVVANSTGMTIDAPALFAPIARIQEVPTLFAAINQGGVFAGNGFLDVFHCLRTPDEVSFAGGVFVVVACHHQESWELLKGKGHILSREGTRALIFIPRHLLGLEAATSVLDAVAFCHSSGAQQPMPRFDLVARTTRSFKAGESLTMGGHHHVIVGATAELLPSRAMSSQAPVPFYLAANRKLIRNVAAGDLILLSDIEISNESELYKLRILQDQHFFS